MQLIWVLAVELACVVWRKRLTFQDADHAYLKIGTGSALPQRAKKKSIVFYDAVISKCEYHLHLGD